MHSFRTLDLSSEREVMPDAELARRLLEGDDPALNEIMRRYKERIYTFVWRHIGDADAAFDVTQETFTRLYFNIDKFDERYRFSTWLFQIALNLCRDHRRKRRKAALDISIEALGLAGHGDWEASGEDVEAVLAARQELGLLARQIDRLPQALREAFILYALEERSQHECAVMLGVSVKAIETRVQRARRMLTGALAKRAEKER